MYETCSHWHMEPETILRLEGCSLDVIPDLTQLRVENLSLNHNLFRFIQTQNLPRQLKYVSMRSNQLTSANIFHTDIYPTVESLVLDDNYIHGIYNLPNNAPISTKNYYPSGTRHTVKKMRSGGCVAPKKKGAIENYSLRNGAVCGWGSIVRQNY